MATHSSVLAWRIPGTGEPVGLASMGSHRVGHDWSDAAAEAADFLGGPVVKSPPANARDMGSIPCSRRFHMPWGNKATEPQLMSLCSRAWELQTTVAWALYRAVFSNKRNHCNEEPVHHNWRVALLSATRESPHTAMKTKCSQKLIILKKRCLLIWQTNSLFSL